MLLRTVSGPGVLVNRGLGLLGSWPFGVCVSLDLLLLLFLGFGASRSCVVHWCPCLLGSTSAVLAECFAGKTHMCGVVVLILTQVMWERTECMLGDWVGMKKTFPKS